ncbi:hypothetical protein HMPREF1870_02889 [Bacteroidales bacterium KA00344]|nr:hypothetical protein HMPREF1870_02889 [Bacteroidales bacterium KA00344]
MYFNDIMFLTLQNCPHRYLCMPRKQETITYICRRELKHL